jgi:DNA-binding transcriptional LysR family regulator
MIHLSQPGLSPQIRARENEMGVRLFERNRRKTAPTAAGVAFREDGTAALLRLGIHSNFLFPHTRRDQR